ncbi:MAG: 16S rRNA (uracil(1498)-N(3))-methyltransferase [Sulfurospirillum sp.]|nr:MAG: 16S rRNA (uracil(1498)-N(3))-methyltransferase [Sulfurospirillum sp.]
MQFLYDQDAGAETVKIEGENHKYLFKVRRFHEGDILTLCNLEDDTFYDYRVTEVHKRDAFLVLQDSRKVISEQKALHLIWCVIDPKTIEKTLPVLNQLGVTKISFVYCSRSQKNFKIDMQRMRKILINSAQQCGRIHLPKIEVLNSLDDMLGKYKDFAVLDFGGEKEWGALESVLIGCEGGFSDVEREKLQNRYKIGLKTDLILKSETAAVAIAAKLLI